MHIEFVTISEKPSSITSLQDYYVRLFRGVTSPGNLHQNFDIFPTMLQILLHSPADFPTSLNTVVAISNTSTQAIVVQPFSIRTSTKIKNWSPLERGCYYDYERNLHYFKLYTEANCNLECESNFSLAQCGCVAFYHPSMQSEPKFKKKIAKNWQFL